jgi:hypothetical protein
MSNFILLNPNAVFIHIPKTGGLSIRMGIWEGSNVYGPHFGTIPSNSMDMFKFAFVREPLDRLISAYSMFQGGGAFGNYPEFKGSIDDFFNIVVDDTISYDVPNNRLQVAIRHHCIPQTHEFNCLQYADFTGHFETYERDLKTILLKVGKDFNIDIPHHNKSKNTRNWEDYMDISLKCRIVEYYKNDYDKLGYTIP